MCASIASMSEVPFARGEGALPRREGSDRVTEIICHVGFSLRIASTHPVPTMTRIVI